MISPEVRAQIRRYFYADHWRIGTIARELGVHPDAVRNAIEAEKFNSSQPLRASVVDPYLGFVRQTLEQHPRLRATRIYAMIRDRGYSGSVGQLRRVVARLRPQPREAFLQLEMFPGEQGQVDWAYFGPVMVGRAKRSLSCFVMTLSHSRALYLEFFFDQTMENFLRGHVHAFAFFGGQPRVILYDNLKSAVLERRGNHISFHPRLIELSAHYHFAPRPCQVRAGAIRYVRESFWAGRTFTTLSECNRQAWFWRDQVAHLRPWPGGDLRTVSQVFEQERARLLPHAAHPFPTERIEPVRSAKTIYVRFDLNQYSIPPEAVGRQLTLAASDTHVRIHRTKKKEMSAEYVAAVLTLYGDLPDTPLRPSPADQSLARRLFADAVPLALVESALLLGTLRRLSRAPGLPPLSKIRSLAYFLPVIEELQLQPLPNGYLDYLRLKLRKISA